MSLALGRSEAEEYADNLFQVSKLLRDQRGLLLTNQTKEEASFISIQYTPMLKPLTSSWPPSQVLDFFSSHEAPDFHRAGSRVSETVHLSPGPLAQFPHSLEPQLRQLGLPTALKKGVVHLLGEEPHKVCQEGDVLTPEQARLLKLLGHQDAKFRLNIIAVWDKSQGKVTMLRDAQEEEESSKENDEDEDVSE